MKERIFRLVDSCVILFSLIYNRNTKIISLKTPPPWNHPLFPSIGLLAPHNMALKNKLLYSEYHAFIWQIRKPATFYILRQFFTMQALWRRNMCGVWNHTFFVLRGEQIKKRMYICWMRLAYVCTNKSNRMEEGHLALTWFSLEMVWMG